MWSSGSGLGFMNLMKQITMMLETILTINRLNETLTSAYTTSQSYQFAILQ